MTAVRCLLALVAAGTLLQGGSATAAVSSASRSSAGLLGYRGSAQADGLHAFYTPEGVLPLPPIVDVGAPDALATITSGPSTFARAGVADPGDLLANPDVLLAAAVTGWKSGTVPPYPYRVSASSSFGEPTTESSPAPGLDARAAADKTGSTALATTPQAAAPAILTVGSMSSTATTTTDGTTVSVHSRSETSNVNLLGLVTIDALVTDLTATGDGSDTVLTGGTTVTGAKMLGQPITIGANGIEPMPGSTTTTADPVNGLLTGVLNTLNGSINELLEAAGIHVTLAGPLQIGDGTAGQLTSAGLRVDLEFSRDTQPGLEALLDALPSLPIAIPGGPSVADLIALAQARHLVYIAVGQGSVLLTTTGGLAPPTPASGSTTQPARPSTPAPTASSAAPSVRSPSLPAASPASQAAPSLTPASTAPVSVNAGIGALLALVLLAEPLVSDRIAQMVQRVLAGGKATACTWED